MSTATGGTRYRRIDLPRRMGRWVCVATGDLLKLQFQQAWPALPKNATRGAIGVFSNGARRRMLDRINAIDWSSVRRGLFLTFTYPDLFKDRKVKERTQDRYLMWRYLEKHMDRKVPILWRTEWKLRKTGKHVGQLMPHHHLVAFEYEYLPCATWNAWWKQTLGWDDYVNTDVRMLKDGQHAAKYISKYVAKPDADSLVVNAYLNNRVGRSWGFKRPELIPWAKTESITDLSPDMVRYAHGVACDLWQRLDREEPDSFTLYGKAARIAWEEIKHRHLTTDPVPGYNSTYQEGKGPEAVTEHLA